MRIWDPVTGAEIVAPPTVHTRRVQGIAAFSGQAGRTLLASASGTSIRIWDPATGTEVDRTLEGHTREIRAVTVFSGPDRRTLLATGGDDATVRIWDPATGTEVPDWLTGQPDVVTSVSPFPDPNGRQLLLTTGGTRGRVWIWDPDRKPSMYARRIGSQIAGIAAVVTVRDGRTLLACIYNRTVRLWEPIADRMVGTPLTGHTERVRAATALPNSCGDTHLVTGSSDGTVRIWSLRTLRCLQTLSVDVPVLGLAALDDHRVAVGFRDGVAVLTVHDLADNGRTAP